MRRGDSVDDVQAAARLPSRETGRVEAFSDGVFAIAITLLILEIKVPQPQDIASVGGLTAALERLWPSFASFVISFVLVFIGWINHHRIFTHIWRVNGPFLFLNGFLLLMYSFVPFPTAVLAAYINRPEARTAAILYAGTLLVLAVSYQLVWRYACKNDRLLKPNPDRAKVDRILREFGATFPFFILAFALAFFSPAASILLIALLLVFFAVTGFAETDDRVA